MTSPKDIPDGWPPVQRAASPAIVQRDPYFTTGSRELRSNVVSVDARRCSHCGCYASPRVSDFTDEDRDLSICARSAFAADPDEEDNVPGVDWFWSNDDGSNYFAPVACAECSNRKGGCQFPQEGWDFTVEWEEDLPPNQELGHGFLSSSICMHVAAVGSAAEAIAVARKEKGDAYAHRIERGKRDETFVLFMGSLVGEFPEVDPPELELIPCRCIP